MPSSPKSQSGQRNGTASRNSSPRKPRKTEREDGNDGTELATRVEDWVQENVDERPWMMVGAAAGIGLVAGALSRPAQGSNVGRMLTATASGVAVRLAINTLVEWLSPQRENGGSEPPARAVH